MTPATVLVSKPAKRAMPWSSWTTMSPVRRSAKRAQQRRGRARVGRVARLAAVDQPVLGERRELEARGDEAVAQVASVKTGPVVAAVRARALTRARL